MTHVPNLAPIRTVEAAAESPERAPTLVDYLALLEMRKWVVAGVLVLIVGVVALYNFSRVPLYQARSILLIEPEPPKVLSNVTEVSELGAVRLGNSREYYETQYSILSSHSLMLEVARRGHLSDDLDFLGIDPKLPPDVIAKRQAGTNPAGMLQGRVSISPTKSQLVHIDFLDADPKRAAMLSNLIGDVYIERNLSTRMEATRNAIAWLDTQMGDLQTKLRDSEQKLDDFKRNKDILSVSLSDKQNLLAVELDGLNEAITSTRIKRMELESKLDAARAARDNTDNVHVIAGVSKDPGIQSLVVRQQELKQELSQVALRYQPEHPNHQSVAAKIGDVETDLNERIEGLLKSLESELRATASFEAKLRSSLGTAKNNALSLATTELDYGRLKRDYDANKAQYDMVVSRLKETSLTGELDTNNARFLERARVPGAPVIPNIPMNIMIAAVFGLLAGIGLALLLAFADDTAKSHDEIEKQLGVPYLGMIPNLKPGGRWRKQTGPRVDADPDLYVYNYPGSQLAEACRTIRSNLVFMSPDKPIKRLLITSAEPSAGKSATVIRLGILLSQTQGKTLLVDADMRRSRLHKVFNTDNTTGLSALIAGECTLDEAITETEIPRVDVMTSARTPPNPAELLHSEQFRTVSDELAKRYNLVIYDTPPLMHVTDAVVLGHHVDGVLLVARWGKSKLAALKRTVEHLRDVQIPVFGVVMNDVDVHRRAYTYYYRIYGGYGRYPYERSKAEG